MASSPNSRLGSVSREDSRVLGQRPRTRGSASSPKKTGSPTSDPLRREALIANARISATFAFCSWRLPPVGTRHNKTGTRSGRGRACGRHPTRRLDRDPTHQRLKMSRRSSSSSRAKRRARSLTSRIGSQRPTRSGHGVRGLVVERRDLLVQLWPYLSALVGHQVPADERCFELPQHCPDCGRVRRIETLSDTEGPESPRTSVGLQVCGAGESERLRTSRQLR